MNELMSLVKFLPIVAVVLAFVGLVVTILDLRSKLRAQGSLAEKLRSHQDQLQEIASVVEYDPDYRERIGLAAVTPSQLADAVAKMRQLTLALPKSDQQKISEGLLQPSQAGQWNYIRRIVKKARSLKVKKKPITA